MAAMVRGDPMQNFSPYRPLVRMKRGPEELLSSSGALLPVMTVDQEAKKAKLDGGAAAVYSQLLATPLAGLSTHLLAGHPIAQIPMSAAATSSSASAQHMTSNGSAGGQPKPSRVVHLRNIPSDMVDVEVVNFCLGFGKITNYMLLKGKNQAFVEYEDLWSASRCVDILAANPIQIRGRTIFSQYSTHQELKVDNTRRSHATNGDATNEVLIGGSSTGTSASQLDISTSTQQQPNAVLRVIIENMVYPVTLDVLHGIFSRFGKVLRIITFNKNNTFQALVQLSEATSAQLAKQALENQNVYNGCCTLRIDYSKLSTLNVKYNNDKSRDYTNPNLPSGELTIEQQLSLAAAAGALPSGTLIPSQFTFPFGANPAAAFLAPQTATMPAGVYSPHDPLAGTGISPFMGMAGMAGMAGMTAMNMNSMGQVSTIPVSSALTLSGAGISPSVIQNSLRFPVNILNLTSVVLISNLDENKTCPDALFTLFGVYGDVIRVKILFNKKDNALIQYSEPQQAQLAIQHLDKVKWHDKVIRVTASKHQTVQMPKEGQPDAGLTRDYSHSPLHRFKKPGSKNYMNIYPPSSTLHLSNIPPNVTEEALNEAFGGAGFVVKAFKFFPKDHKMALLQLEDVETAIDALIQMHNHKLAENAHLRVSFSKSAI